MNGVRLYWWIRGADPNRIGGPWWCMDFLSREKALAHLKGMGSALTVHRAKLAKIPDGKFGRYNGEGTLKPPDDAEDLV